MIHCIARILHTKHCIDGCVLGGHKIDVVCTSTHEFVFCFRFSSSVHITSVHLRASSVLRLVVKPGDDPLGNGHTSGRTVSLPVFDGQGESRVQRSVEQDIDVDVRDVPRCCGVINTCTLL